jgi:hypothetical protein
MFAIVGWLIPFAAVPNEKKLGQRRLTESSPSDCPDLFFFP